MYRLNISTVVFFVLWIVNVPDCSGNRVDLTIITLIK